jgi:hypothetical protein
MLLQSADVQSQVSGFDGAPSFGSPNGCTEHQFNFKRGLPPVPLAVLTKPFAMLQSPLAVSAAPELPIAMLSKPLALLPTP